MPFIALYTVFIEETFVVPVDFYIHLLQDLITYGNTCDSLFSEQFTYKLFFTDFKMFCNII